MSKIPEGYEAEDFLHSEFDKCLDLFINRQESYGDDWLEEDISVLEANVIRKAKGVSSRLENKRKLVDEDLRDLIDYSAMLLARRTIEGKNIEN